MTSIVQNGFYLQSITDITSEEVLILLREEQLRSFYAMLNPRTDITPVLKAEYFGDPIKYVFGWKGTGKTTMLKYFGKKIDGINAGYIYINCRVYDTPSELLRNIKNELYELYPQVPQSPNDREYITNVVKQIQNRQIFLFIDEVDKPLRNTKTTQKDEFLHFITRLTSENPKGNFKIIFTTNVVNIERWFSDEVRSFVGASKVVFGVYVVPQLVDILERRARMGLLPDSWDKKDLMLIAQTTYNSFDGDVRKALDILLSLAKISTDKLDISKLDKVIDEIKKNDLKIEVAAFPQPAQVFLKSIIIHILPTKQGDFYFKDEFSTDEAFDWYNKYCTENGEKMVSISQLYNYINKFSESMILNKTTNNGYKLVQNAQRLNECLDMGY